MCPCIFCEILAGAQPASIIYRDELIMAMMDIQPITPGHVLVIPVIHACDLTDLPPETGAQMFVVAQRIAQVLLDGKGGVRCEGVNLWLASGTVAGQDVFHAHLHVIPRYVGDPFHVHVDGSYTHAPRAQLDAVAAVLAGALADCQESV